ncbi:hypothetical protein TrLO_g5101 [Triparma laevis f. longispina]|uniref:Amino acid transporter transmembrane domain-containing protein n=1 Tax=Triparma laevis f. longispina TaxID=1714387 RepID=A0A9W6ZLR6_9STRA|nr:hypothetical protein TrLO_g5101 [Triparma laevis f. longispina]
MVKKNLDPSNSSLNMDQLRASLSALIPDPKQSSNFAATLNFTNCVLGAGIIGTGGAIASSGFTISIFTLVLCALLTRISLDMIIRLGDTRNGANFEKLGELAFGNLGKKIVGGAKFLYSFGCCCAYIVVIRKNLGSGLINISSCSTSLCKSVFNDEVFCTIVCLTLVLPLSLKRNLDSLSRFSFISVCCVVLIASIVFSEFLDRDPLTYSDNTLYFEVRSGYISSLGTFVFAFVSQHTHNGIYSSMKNQTPKDWEQVSLYSITIACTVTVLTGSFAYLTFGLETTSDLFTVYHESVQVDLAEILLSFTMIFTFPMPFYTCRALVGEWFFSVQEVGGGEFEVEDMEEALLKAEGGGEEEEVEEAKLSNFQWTVTSLGLFAVSLTIALTAPNLGAVLDFVGCASGSAIAFILPAAIFVKLENHWTPKVVVMAIVGAFVGIVGTGFAVANIIFPSD